MAKSKNGAVTTTKNGVNIDAVNLEIVEELKGSFSLEKELEVYLKIDRLNADGMLSINGIKATIEEVEKVGSAPSLKSSYAQDFPLVRSLRGLKGNDKKSLKELFNLAVAGRKAYGGTASMVEEVSKAKSATALAKDIKEKTDAKNAEKNKTRGAGKETADEKKAGKVKTISPTVAAEAICAWLEAGNNLSEELLERLTDAITEAFARLEEGEEKAA